MNIDWEMFKVQKQYLVSLADNPPAGQLANVELIDGIIHLMDYIQDEYAPEEIND
jgi:hypothetical protein